MINNVAGYLAALHRIHSRRDTTEHTYRPALKTFVETFDPSITAVNEPARQRCGAPDHILTRNDLPLGYIETKNIGKNLDDPEYKEQLDRYRAALSNLIVTNYTRFQFYRDTRKIADIDIAEFKDGKIKPLREKFSEFENLFREFCQFKGAVIHSAHDLASFLAGKATLLADVIRNALTIEDGGSDNQTLQEQLKSFQKVLIPDMNAAMFADLYAQTVTYGMFAGRLHHKTAEIFTRQMAAEKIPKSHPFLRKLFSHIAGPDVDDRIRWVVDELADLLQVANIKLIMEDFGKTTKTEDATIHFYEDFLTAYNPELRKTRGVFYTPQPAVNYIVRAVDALLRQEFKLRDGIADNSKIDIDGQTFHKVQILDPATGTGTFLAEVIRQIHTKIVEKNMQGAWNNYAGNDLLPRLHGFEILMAPYAMAHLKLDMILEDTGYRFEKNQRVGIYLTNALDGGFRRGAGDYLSGFVAWLVNEAQESHRIKRKMPIMVVLGNPPYNVSTMNRNEFSSSLLENYKEGLKEKKTNLDDDYIKFIALGQRFIDRNHANGGILAYISNNSFLDGVTHRNMRKSLLKTFDKIYILNLHGDARKKETTPDGGKDENVFNIRQGTSINIFVRSPAKKKGEWGKVFYADLYGKRTEKYHFLETQSLKTTGFTELALSDQFYSFFTPKDFSAREEYEKGFRVDQLFLISNSGIKTDRDALFIDDDKERLAARFKKLLAGKFEESFREKYRIEDSSGYKLTKLIQGKQFDHKFLRRIFYRPFDEKWIYYDPSIVSRTAEKVMQHMHGENIALITERISVQSLSSLAFITKQLCEVCYFTSHTHVFPLYTYNMDGGIDVNLSQEIVSKIAKQIGKKIETLSEMKIFDYIYGVLHDPNYRTKYQEFLKIDFPRVPYPKDTATFDRYVTAGSRLRKLHLLEDVPKIQTTFPVTDGNVVENVRFVDGKVFINDTQYFDNVPAEAWNFYIGGYQPAQKYLKDRKGRTLTFEEIQHYQKIVCTLKETIKIMDEADNVGNQ